MVISSEERVVVGTEMIARSRQVGNLVVLSNTVTLLYTLFDHQINQTLSSSLNMS